MSSASASSSSAVHSTTTTDSSSQYIRGKAPMASTMNLQHGDGGVSVNSGNERVSAEKRNLTQSVELKRMSEVGRKKNFVFIEDINGKGRINVLQGLELHTRVFNQEEQEKIVNYVDSLLRMAHSGKLRAHTYRKRTVHGKERVTLEFGCCYNYALVGQNGTPRDIIGEVDPIPYEFKLMIKRMVKWHILPPTCIPNNCIIRIYEEGDYISPQHDHHHFLLPICTASFQTESNILFGSNLKVEAPGKFSGAESITIPIGSVHILNGNVASVAKHCVPATPGKRISVTFRKMDDSELPFKFFPDPFFQGILPLGSSQANNLVHRPSAALNFVWRRKTQSRRVVEQYYRQR